MGDDARLAIGTIVRDTYRITGVLGHGGSGHTYAAEHVATGARVALKRFDLKASRSWKSLELFEREARVLRALDHPSIPKLVDAFANEEDGVSILYIAQTIANGTPLDAWLASGARVDEAEVVRIAASLLETLTYLHALSPAVIHRDIKPTNVLCADDGRLSLVDFGAVREAPTEGTVGGSTSVGTYGFMAPEQYRGLAVPASDLFGVGATLVFLLTRKSPDQLPQRRLRVELPASLPISKPVAAWLVRMLEPAPEDRYASASDALDALRRAQRGEIAGGKPSRARVAILAGALVAVAGAAATTVLLTWNREPKTTATVVSAPKPALALLGGRYPRPHGVRYAQVGVAQTQHAHADDVTAIDTSRDGKLAVTSSRDQTVKIWSVDGWTARLTIPASGDYVMGAVFADGDTSIASASSTLVRLHDAATGKALGQVDLKSKVIDLAAAPDGKRLAATTAAGMAFLLDVPSLAILRTFEHDAGKPTHAVAFRPDGKAIATGGESGNVIVWNLEDGSRLGTYADHTDAIDHLAFSPDGALLAATSDDGTVSFRSSTNPWPRRLRASDTEIWNGAFSPDGATFITGDMAGSIEAFSVPAYHERWALSGRGEIEAVAFTRDGRFALFGGRGGSVVILDLPDFSESPPPVPDQPLAPAPDPTKLTPIERAEQLLAEYSGDLAKIDEAKAITDALLAKAPNDAAALTTRGRASLFAAMQTTRRHDPRGLRDAIAWFDKALAVDASFDRAHRGKAFALLKQSFSLEGDARTARLDDARREAELVRDAFDRAYVESALAYEEQAYGPAREHALRAVRAARTREELAQAYDNLLDADVGLRRFGEAAATHRRLIELDPASAWSKGNYASFLLRIGEVDPSIAASDAALETMRYPAGLSTLADAYAEQGVESLWNYANVTDAKASFDRALSLSAGCELARYGMIALRAFEAEKRGVACATCRADLEALVIAEPKFSAAKIALERL